MKHRFILPAAFFACAMLMASFSPKAVAQSGFVVEVHDSVGIATPDLPVELKATVRNTGFMDVSVRIVRLKNELPGGQWYSAICTGELCYPQGVDTTEFTVLKQGKVLETKLSVGRSGEDNGMAKITLRFDSGNNTQGFEQTFTINAATSGIEIDNGASTRLAAFPNPAATFAVVPFAAGVASENDLSLAIFDLYGRMVADLTGVAQVVTKGSHPGVRVDVSTIANGTYFYRLSAGGKTTGGPIVVAR